MITKKNDNITTNRRQPPAQSSYTTPGARNTVSPWISSGVSRSPASPGPSVGKSENVASPWISQNQRPTGNNNIPGNASQKSVAGVSKGLIGRDPKEIKWTK